MISRSEIFLLLDGFSRYNHVLVTEPDCFKTMFKTKWGNFTFKRMPFRVINVSATFQRAMDIVFHGLIGKNVFIYSYGITVFSKKRSNHIHHLKKIFK